MKDRMVVIDQDKVALYDSVTTSAPAQVYNFSDIKEVLLVKEETDISHSLDAFDFGDPSKIGVVFHLKFKNERGGVIIEPDSSNVQKWDYIFFVMNVILSQQLVQSLSFKPLTTEANQGKVFKSLNIKNLDTVTLKKQMAFEYEFPVDDSKVLDEVEDRLIDWQILDRCAAMHHDNLFKKMGGRAMKEGTEEGNSKATQTEVIYITAGGKDVAADISDIGASVEQYTKDATRGVRDFNYSIPTLSSFVGGNSANHRKSLGRVLVGTNNDDFKEGKEKAAEEVVDEIPSPQVELDVSLDSIEQDEPDLLKEDLKTDVQASTSFLNQNQNSPKSRMCETRASLIRILKVAWLTYQEEYHLETLF